MSLTTPVALIVFNRPERTKQMLKRLLQVKPKSVYVVADGPRATCPDDTLNCSATRELVAGLKTECDLHCNYAESNLGCKRRVSSGLDWVFQHCEEAIILEDDCLPDPTFFPFCDELLQRYRNNEQISMISGSNLLRSWKKEPYSYLFSRTYSIWGWATWRRAWQHYDVTMKNWPCLRDQPLFNDPTETEQSIQRTRSAFDNTYAGLVDTWDYQWSFCCAERESLCIVPRVNLISNTGFSSDATHTKRRNRYAELPTAKMRLPLSHPDSIHRDAGYDFWVNNPKSSLFKSVKRKLRQSFGWMLPR